MTPKQHSENWLAQARADLLWCEDTLKQDRFASACFVAQQAGEKAIKALGYAKGAIEVRGHSIVKIARELNINDQLLEAGYVLDLYYIPTRYPDALPDGGIPSERFSRRQAEEALAMAKMMIEQIGLCT